VEISSSKVMWSTETGRADVFTGLVRDVGEIRERTEGDDSVSFVIETSLDVGDFEAGESMAVDGVCLTVTEFDSQAGTFGVDVAAETLRKTALGDRDVGDGVHLERALRVGDRLGGHFVQGHVDGVGELVGRRRDGDGWELEFRVPAGLARLIIEKGSIAVDGVSLTAYNVQDEAFTVTIVPHTSNHTNLLEYAEGRRVNLEADMLGKYVQKLSSGDAESRVPPTPGRH
jgi:riboflavin synthase